MAETTKATTKKVLTDEEKNILLERKLAEFSRRLSVPKKEHNDFGNYMYRTAEAILNACKVLGAELNASVFTDAELMPCEGKFFLKTTATFTDLDTGAIKQAHSYTLHDLSKPKMSAEQVSGSCNSYGAKYALQNLLAIDNSELDPDTRDNTNATGYNGEVPRQEQKQQNAALAKKEDVDAAIAVLKSLNTDIKFVMNSYGVNTLYDLSAEQMEHLKAQIAITKKKKAMQEQARQQNVVAAPLNA